MTAQLQEPGTPTNVELRDMVAGLDRRQVSDLLDRMSPKVRRQLARALAPRVVEPYVPHVPHPPQQVYLLQDGSEAFYGGAAGGGKSDALLMAALQYCDVPGYSALLLRRTFSDLAQPGAIMDRADTWLRETPAKHQGTKTWAFPTLNPQTGELDFTNPARLTFGYLQYHKDTKQYIGAEYQFIGVDEVTQFELRTYSFMFSRLRGPSLRCQLCGHPASKLAGAPWMHDEGHPDDCLCGDYVRLPADSPVWDVVDEDDVLREAVPDRSTLAAAEDGTTLADVPLRMRSASNPGGVGHAWARDRFVDPDKRRHGVFVPAKIEDNPSLDKRAYRQSLSHLSPLEIARLEQGDWDVADEGELFQRHWFELVERLPNHPPEEWTACRWWDLAATAAEKGKDPDYTVGSLVLQHKPTATAYVADVVRLRGTPAQVEKAVVQAAQVDAGRFGRRVRIRMEQEPGSSGKNTIHRYRVLLQGYDFRGEPSRESKTEKARPLASAAEPGYVKIVHAPWNQDFLDEMAGFPTATHDDIVDATSGAYSEASGQGGRKRVRIIA